MFFCSENFVGTTSKTSRTSEEGINTILNQILLKGKIKQKNFLKCLCATFKYFIKALTTVINRIVEVLNEDEIKK